MRHHVKHDTLARKLVPGDLVKTRDDMSLKLGELEILSDFPANEMKFIQIHEKSVAVVVATIPHSRDDEDHITDYAFLLMPQNVGWVFSSDSVESGLVTYDGMPYDNRSTLALRPRDHYDTFGTSYNYQ